jgi:phosphatidylserine decarboxylase
VLNALVQFYFPEVTALRWFIYILSFLLFVIIVQFFRSPNLTITTDENAVLCPADGKVVVIEEADETEYLKDRRIQLSVFMSPVNVHVNRNPVAGVVKYFKYHPGKYLVAWHPKSSTENERTTIVTENSAGVPVLFRQIAGALARRIVWYVKEGDKVEQGEQFGFIKFGSRVDLFLPLGSTINVELGQVVKGGKTILAELPKHATPVKQSSTTNVTAEKENAPKETLIIEHPAAAKTVSKTPAKKPTKKPAAKPSTAKAPTKKKPKTP